MPVVHDITFPLSIEQVLRGQGTGNQSRVPPKTLSLSHELLEDVRRLRLIQPRMAYKFCPVRETGRDYLVVQGGVLLRGPFLVKHFARAKELALMVCTVGPHLEKRVTDYVGRNDYLRAVLLDGIGTADVGSLEQEGSRIVHHEARSWGYEASIPGFSLHAQYEICRIVSADKLGVHFTPSTIAIPRKSLSMVVGVGLGMPAWTIAEACSRCNMRDTCRYRDTDMSGRA